MLAPLQQQQGTTRTTLHSFPSPRWDCVSSEAIDLVRSLMRVNPKKRYGLKETLDHPFVRKHVDVDSLSKERRRILDAMRKHLRADRNATSGGKDEKKDADGDVKMKKRG